MNGLSQPWVDACLFYELRVSVDSRPTYTGLLRYSWSQLRRKAVKQVAVVVATISATHLLRLDDAPRHTTMFDKWQCPLHCTKCNRSDVESTSFLESTCLEGSPNAITLYSLVMHQNALQTLTHVLHRWLGTERISDRLMSTANAMTAR